MIGSVSQTQTSNDSEEELEELHEVMDEVVNGNESVLENYSKEKLRLLRNTLYAEKGYIFTGDLKGYFKSKPWYHGHISNQDSIPLSSEEKSVCRCDKKIWKSIENLQETVIGFNWLYWKISYNCNNK